MNEKAVAQPKKKVTAGQYLKKNWPLYVMLLIPMAYVILFKYVPLAGLAIAFKDFNVFKGIWGSEWVGFKYFAEAFQKVEFWKSVKNTLIINLGDLIFCWPFPIFLAIVMSEMSRKSLAKWTQTILYIPHFLSNVIIFGIIFSCSSVYGEDFRPLRSL